MNSGSDKRLSMDELLEKNRPAQTVQSTPQPTMHERTPPEVHPTKEEWEELIDYLYTLGYHAEKQTGLMKKASELLTQLPTKEQMDEFLKAAKHLEHMAKVQGKVSGSKTNQTLPESQEHMAGWKDQMRCLWLCAGRQTLLYYTLQILPLL